MKYNLQAVVILLCFLPMGLAAQISVRSTTASEDCESGSIMVQAEGSAGPFLVLLQKGGQVIDSRGGVNGQHTFTDISPGFYEVQVMTEAFYCVKKLEVEVECTLAINGVIENASCRQANGWIELSLEGCLDGL